MRSTIRIAAVLILVAFTFPVLAQDEADEMMGMMGQRAGWLLEGLNLTDQQKKDLEKIRFDFQKQMIESRAKLRTARLELVQLMRAESPDRSAIEKKANEITQLDGQARLSRLNHWFAVRKILTPEQQKLLKERAADRWMKFREDRMERRFGRPEMRGQRFQRMPRPEGPGRWLR